MMMTLGKRIDAISALGRYMLSDDPDWQTSKAYAVQANAWFTPEHVDMATHHIAQYLSDRDRLHSWMHPYKFPDTPRRIGIVMAGNIPLVGFHDFLCTLLCGHHPYIKLSSKDQVLLPHLIQWLIQHEPVFANTIRCVEQLRGCEAYIATGSNNSARYFTQYFARFPHIIRQNRTSVAVLDGSETEEDLYLLGRDIFTYYGLGCRNVTQVCVPEGYSFDPLLHALTAYSHYMTHHKYKHNFDYHLSVYLLNNIPVLTNDVILLVANELPFSAVSVLHYRYYSDRKQLVEALHTDDQIQTIVGKDHTPFGMAQSPAPDEYADGVDTMAFLCGLD